MGEGKRGGQNAYVPPPAITAGIVAVGNLNGGLIGFDAATGKQKWEVKDVSAAKAKRPSSVHSAVNPPSSPVTVEASRPSTPHRARPPGFWKTAISVPASGSVSAGSSHRAWTQRNSRSPGSGPACYTFDATGATLAWRLDEVRFRQWELLGITVWDGHGYWVTSKDNKAGGRRPANSTASISKRVRWSAASTRAPRCSRA